MKKRLIYMASLLLLAVAVIACAVTVAKYIAVFVDKDITFTMSDFYFRSNLLTDSEIPEEHTVNAYSTEFVLTNGSDSENFTSVDLSYDINYYVEIDGDWTKVDDASETGTMAYGAYRVHPITVAPITYNGVEYKRVLIEAQATAPNTKTLRAIVNFDYDDYEIEYEFNENGFTFYVSLIIKTNDIEGDYTISWIGDFYPDNADPNGILTNALVGPSNVSAHLEAHTVYKLNFFVNASTADSVRDLSYAEILPLLPTATLN